MPANKAAADRQAWIHWALKELKPIRFKGALLYKAKGTKGYTPMNRRNLADAIFEKDVSAGKAMIDQVLDVLLSVSPDWTKNARYIDFGEQTWDAKTLKFVDQLSVNAVYSSQIAINDSPTQIALVREYLLSLANGDEELAYDYLQMMAPLFMTSRPVGVIWAIGAGANGKSAYLEAMEKVVGKHLAHLTIEQIEDGRGTPSLQGVLGNIVTETSEKRVEDMQHYKNIGAHEPFTVRTLGTHDMVTVDTNFHTVFSANNIPAFGDKSMGSRRRTLLVPFPAVFKDDPGFQERTFTPAFLGAWVHLILETTKDIAAHGYRWSAASRAVQERYNKDANTAEAFARHLDEEGIAAFKNYNFLQGNYEQWCADQGIVSLGRTQLARAVDNILKPVLKTYREDSTTSVVRRYIRPGYEPTDLVWVGEAYGMPKPSAKVLKEQMQLEEGNGDW